MTPQALGLPGVAAVLLAVGAVLLAWPRPAGVQRLRHARPTGRTRERWLLAILGLLALTAPLLLRPGAPAAAVAVGVLAVWGVIRLVGRARRAREAAVRR